MTEIIFALVFIIPALLCINGLIKAKRAEATEEEPKKEMDLDTFNRYRDWN